jgi:hypothetical protein
MLVGIQWRRRSSDHKIGDWVKRYARDARCFSSFPINPRSFSASCPHPNLQIHPLDVFPIAGQALTFSFPSSPTINSKTLSDIVYAGSSDQSYIILCPSCQPPLPVASSGCLHNAYDTPPGVLFSQGTLPYRVSSTNMDKRGPPNAYTPHSKRTPHKDDHGHGPPPNSTNRAASELSTSKSRIRVRDMRKTSRRLATPHQLSILETALERSRTLTNFSQAEKDELCERTNMTPRQVGHWFQNR